MKKISFDFDGTLEFKEIQDYAKELVERGFEVWIVTTRYEDVSKYSFNISHDDLYEAVEYTGIQKNHIHFNNMKHKHTFFKNNNFTFHLDDNPDEKRLMIQQTDTPCIMVFGYQWREQCEKLLTLL